jgi:4,5:9,10-diseco-3-hydroxy-5,9,17-trioxoandrosta-1(10),2-diene-4-oate hydrolase
MTTDSSARAADPVSAVLDGDGDGSIHYHEAGEGPALVLLHGSGPGVSAWSNFSGTLPAFAPTFRTIAPDLPGFGRSSVPAMDRPYHRIASDAVVRLLDGLGIKRLIEFTRDPTRERIVAWLKTMVADQALITDELVEERMANALAPGALEWMRTFFSHVSGDGPARPVDPVPLWAEVSRITAPTLITWGREDRVTPLENALLPLRQMQDVELHVFANCGHWAMIERAEEFDRVVLEFLTR